jgi:hypothetical protein
MRLAERSRTRWSAGKMMNKQVPATNDLEAGVSQLAKSGACIESKK